MGGHVGKRAARPDGRVLRLDTFSCPMTGEKNMRFQGEWEVIDNATLSYSMYNPGPDGKDVKGMEISYKQVK